MEKIKSAYRIGSFCERISNKLPIQGKCLTAAVTFVFYARKYEIPYVLHIGLTKPNLYRNSEMKISPERVKMSAHAWVRVGSEVVCGARDMEQFHIIASYRHPKF